MIFQSIPSLHMQKHPLKMFCKKVILGNFVNRTGKRLVLESSFNKVLDSQACNFIKKRLQHIYFTVKFSKFSRALILKNICERLLLYVGSVNSMLAAEISKAIRGPLFLFPYRYCVTNYVVMHSFLRLLQTISVAGNY